MTPLQEALTKAQQCADMLTSDLTQTHSAAIQHDEWVLEIILRRLISEARDMALQLNEIGAAVK